MLLYPNLFTSAQLLGIYGWSSRCEVSSTSRCILQTLRSLKLPDLFLILSFDNFIVELSWPFTYLWVEVILPKLPALLFFDSLLSPFLPQTHTCYERVYVLLRQLSCLLYRHRLGSIRLKRRINAFRVLHHAFKVYNVLQLLSLEILLLYNLFVSVLQRRNVVVFQYLKRLFRYMWLSGHGLRKPLLILEMQSL